MSALARPNLVEFVEFLSRRLTQINADGLTQRREDTNVKDNTEIRQRQSIQIFNVCDTEAYEFNRVIQVFKKSGIRPNRPVISVPLSFVWLATRFAGLIFRNKKEWIHSGYDKLASDLVFDNRKMLETGFRPIHALETIFIHR
jgi:hypothetical protein